MRLFVAVWPPPHVVDALAALPRPVVPGLRWTTPEQWHVTLRFLGEVDLIAARHALAAIDTTAPVAAELGPVTGRFGRRVLHVPVAGLDGLAASTAMATAGVGEPLDRRAFTGHVMLARARSSGGIDLRGLAGVAVAAGWRVGEVTLVASRLHPHGARYEVVDARSLVGSARPAS